MAATANSMLNSPSTTFNNNISNSNNNNNNNASFFSVVATGQIESAFIPSHDNLYCKFAFVNGPDWIVISGVEEGITQMSCASQTNTFSAETETSKAVVWNFPLDIAFKATNAYGWPQMVVSVYGMDAFGRDVIRGYGSIRLPRTPGQHTLYVPVFVPLASSPFNGFLSWIMGRLPEFLDSRFVSKGEGREVTRVKSQGMVKITLNVVLKDFEKFGYAVSNVRQQNPVRIST